MKLEAAARREEDPALELACVNTIRTLAMDAVERARSGHPGAPMGMAPMAHVLWTRFMRHNPADPGWVDRDRFILSAGHASMLLYSLLYLTGYDLSLDDLKNFRRWGSRTPGHPEHGLTPGVETTTGPLGQGFATGVGMAMAERRLAERFNRPGFPMIDHHTYAIVSDGDLMEGLASEAASLAGHLRLGKLVYLYDSNSISIDGPTDLAFTEDVGARFASYDWHVARVADGNDLEAISEAIAEARSERRPSLIVIRTHIGFGAPNKQDTAAAHGAPLGPDEVRAAKRALGCAEDGDFDVPGLVLERMRAAGTSAGREQERWLTRMDEYAEAHPTDAAELERVTRGELHPGWDAGLPRFVAEQGPVATRTASGAALNALAAALPELVGGSADLAESNSLLIESADVFRPGRSGGYVHFGVREHAMGAALNGMALHGGVRPFGGTFLIFSDYMRPAIRLAALMETPSIFVFTHDSIGLGEDGPTHQPVEQLAGLRAIPNLVVIRPADATETVEAWHWAIGYREGPVALCLTRQSLPVLELPEGDRPPVERGAYVLQDPDGLPDVLLIATGSEVHLALEAAALLEAESVRARVVSMPSWELFERQDAVYRDSVLPPSVTARVSVEAASSFGWRTWTGSQGELVGLDRFGASAPGGVVMERLGFTPSNVARAAFRALTRGAAPIRSAV